MVLKKVKAGCCDSNVGVRYRVHKVICVRVAINVTYLAGPSDSAIGKVYVITQIRVVGIMISKLKYKVP